MSHAAPALFDRRRFTASLLAAGLAGPVQAASASAIEEAGFVRLNGIEQWVTIRGRDRSNPVVLILGGGPGVPTTYLAPAFKEWEEHFTVVQWDQPGSGGTFLRNGGVAGIGEVTVDRFARDGIALAEYVAKRCNKRSIHLLGYSWGSMVGLTMIARRPRLFSAYLGTGQAVDVARADELSYRLVLDRARERKDDKAVAALEAIGPPPFTFEHRLVKQQYATAPTEQERARGAEFTRVMASAPQGGSRSWPASLGRYDAQAAFLATQRASFADAQNWSAARLGNRFSVPMLFAQGEEDMNTVTPLVREFARQVRAPRAEVILIPGAGHGTFPYFRRELLELLGKLVV